MTMSNNKTSSKSVRFSSEAPAIIPSKPPQHQQDSSSQDFDRQWIDLAPLHQQIKCDVKACKQSLPEAADLYTLFDCPVQERIAFLVRLNQGLLNVRGLERHVCKKHKVKLHCIKKGSIQAVLDLQKELLAQSEQPELSYQERAQKLKQVSEQHSRTARVFARLLALADERVLQEDQEAETERQPRSKSDSSALRSGSTLAQMQQSRTTSPTAATATPTIKEQHVVVPLPSLPLPVEECDRNQTVSNAA